MRITLLVSLAAGIGVYAALTRFFGINMFISSGISIFIFIALRRLIKKLILERNPGVTALTPLDEQAATVVKDGIKRLKDINASTIKIKNNEAAAKVKDICRIGIDIFNQVKKDPKDLRRIRQFTVYYLDAAEKIVNQYIELSSSALNKDEINASLQKVEDVLDTIKVTFEKQYANLFEDDILDLDAEITLLKKTIKLES